MNDEQISAATVRIPELGGQGVLVADDLILTAAHCVALEMDVVAFAMDDHFSIGVETASGEAFNLSPIFLDPTADLAVLAVTEYTDEKFWDFTSETAAVPLSEIAPPVFEGFPIRIRSHKQTWITGTGQFCNEHRHSIYMKTAQGVECGTSGGPIVDASGRLVSVMSHSQSESRRSEGEIPGAAPFVSRCLPVWIRERIKSSENTLD